ncbi:CRISPR-associated protein Cas4 [Salisediminibacterium halotolerans]|uniref:CRISPR-associated exonuclease Cas4 n=1 Tax=Salisediminibacterium halotolerans TaxID=517425 RepID=A0A1H9T613_9BACI|nr:CRISPR-associated protein Cas4 [Salisediminibacterium haloalkalitolerans]SER92586.1 CRISPR-associated exonuclease Cas4 [Salisediminibacterium haloalkalitolerans]
MENNEDNYLMISGIQHYEFCKRQWALIHIEQQWFENVKTVEGSNLHNKADNPHIREKRNDKIIVRSMAVKSTSLEITGVCDVVEFIQNSNGVWLDKEEDYYQVCPVEYKRGRPKQDHADILQMAAQAVCLEEMFLTTIEKGYIFYGEKKERLEVLLSDDIRNELRKTVQDMHQMYKKRLTPKVKTGKHCKSCSLQSICLPDMLNKSSVKSYIERKIAE